MLLRMLFARQAMAVLFDGIISSLKFFKLDAIEWANFIEAPVCIELSTLAWQAAKAEFLKPLIL